MPEVKFTNAGKLVTEHDIEQIETELGFVFPPDVRRFYLHTNGGRPYPHLFPKDGELFAVHQFLPLKFPNPRLTVESTYRDLTTDPATSTFPKYLVPIAIDPGGDHYCFSSRKEDFGAMYCFSWEHYNEPERAIIYLAERLDSFLDALVEESFLA